MSILNRVFAALLALIGVLLVWLGGQLIMRGGSFFYLPSGVALLACAYLIFKRSPRSLSVFGGLFAFTLLWSLWEAGLNAWALVPRLGLFIAIGLWMLTPWFRQWVGKPAVTPIVRGAWIGVLAVAVLSAGALFWGDRITGGKGAPEAPGDIAAAEWRDYGKTPGGTRYSPLTQITAQNVGGLEPAWIYSLGKEPNGEAAAFEATPLAIGDRLYLCSGYNDIIALDSETGQQVWRSPAYADTTGIFGQTCRGVSYYKNPKSASDAPCAERVYTATIDSRLIALDVRDGKRCTDFGENGEVNLLTGLSAAPKGYYHVTSPPAVLRGKLVIGGWVTDGQRTGEPSGVIRAFDAITGQLSWAWDMAQPERTGAPPKGETYTPGTPNSWAPMSADEALGLVYVPTGNATPDYYGGTRTPVMDRYSSSVVALDAENGRPRWSFQTAHHDLWDYDVASQPVLIDLADGRPALLQATKRGELFLLDRRTGEPIDPVQERPVASGRAQGERYSPTQPFPTGIPSFAGTPPSEKTMWGLTPIDQAWCRLQFRRARFEGSMTPVGADRPVIQWPASLGGMNWGSIAVDPVRQIALINTTHMAGYNRLITRADADKIGLKAAEITSFENVAGPVAQEGTPYAASVKPFVSPLFVPCTQPPFGKLAALDLKTRKLLWEKPFGTARKSGPLGLKIGLPLPMGVPNIGGAVVTGSGLSFIGATQDQRIRAFDLSTGAELWKADLPAGGNATPITYWSAHSGRQFVVIAVGGHAGIMSGYSDKLIAFALPPSAKK